METNDFHDTYTRYVRIALFDDDDDSRKEVENMHRCNVKLTRYISYVQNIVLPVAPCHFAKGYIYIYILLQKFYTFSRIRRIRETLRPNEMADGWIRQRCFTVFPLQSVLYINFISLKVFLSTRQATRDDRKRHS